MATPLGHSIVGLLVGRAFGSESLAARAFAVGVASLPDIDVPAGQFATGELLGLHHRIVTHQPQFAIAAGAVAGVAGALCWGPRAGGRAAALTTALVGSHLLMDLLPLPYDTTPMRSVPFTQAALTHGWNAVIDLAVYGGLGMVLTRICARRSGSP